MHIPSSLQIFKNKKVFLTGHTGFKGAWLLKMLHILGAEVTGYALAPSDDGLYAQFHGDQYCATSIIDDIRNQERLQAEILQVQPDFIFHLAAQALVRTGYEDPVGTYATNVMGTVHVLEALRKLPGRCTAIMITTDKVYENPEDGIPFVETDKLGGYDPYSASKACDEILIDSFRNSYFPNNSYDAHLKSIASVRAGNVIGGGDDAANRIIPDIVRAIHNNEPVELRNPQAVRPWQLVIEPLYAYLLLASKMFKSPTTYNEAFNIGPEASDMLTVKSVATQFIQSFGKGSIVENINPDNVHEAQMLLLNNQKIKDAIGFKSALAATTAIQWTAEWYADQTISAESKCDSQIQKYFQLQSSL